MLFLKYNVVHWCKAFSHVKQGHISRTPFLTHAWDTMLFVCSWLCSGPSTTTPSTRRGRFFRFSHSPAVHCEVEMNPWSIYIYKYMSHGRNYSFGENAITKCGTVPYRFCSFWIVDFRGIGFGGGGPWAASKFKATSYFSVHSTNFLGYW